MILLLKYVYGHELNRSSSKSRCEAKFWWKSMVGSTSQKSEKSICFYIAFYVSKTRIHLLIFSQKSIILTEYVRVEPKLSVCVCVFVFLSALQPKRLSRFWLKFTKMLSRVLAIFCFLKFRKCLFDDVMTTVLYKCVPALSSLNFWSDCLQIRTWCSLHQGISSSM